MEFGEIVLARILTTKKLGNLGRSWLEVVWTGKAEDSDEHVGLDHRGDSESCVEPESSRWRF